MYSFIFVHMFSNQPVKAYDFVEFILLENVGTADFVEVCDIVYWTFMDFLCFSTFSEVQRAEAGYASKAGKGRCIPPASREIGQVEGGSASGSG